MKKYELTNECIQHGTRKLYRIKAIKAFGNIKAGELGGFIEKEDNLSHEGDAWVYSNAVVFGDARVSGYAEIYDDTHLLQIGGIGSRDSITTFFRTKEKEIYVTCGCFRGSINEFEKAVEATHAGTKHEKTYKLAIELAKAQVELDD